MNLDDLPKILDDMLSKQKEKRAKTFVARFKGKNLIMRSGKSSWKAIGHAKTALIQHFDSEEHKYVYSDEKGQAHPLAMWQKYSYELRDERRKQFRAELFKLIEIVELTE